MGQWSRGPNEPPFIDLVPPEEAEGERKTLYGERVRGPGRVSNLFRAYSAFPALGMANFRRLGVLLAQGGAARKPRPERQAARRCPAAMPTRRSPTT